MAAITGTKLNNDATNGYVVADGFLGAPSSTDNANARLSTQPAVFPNGFTTGGASVAVVAAAGSTQGAATAIPSTALIVNVTATTSSEGVKLPTASTGKTVTLLPPTTKGVKAYGGAAGQLINAATTATTAYVMVSATPAVFYAVDATHWRVYGETSLSLSGTLSITGLSTLTGGGTYGGAQKEIVTVVAAAGATQGTATAIAAGANLVNVTVTASTEGVKLPTASTGRVVMLVGPTTKGFKVYGGAAGQLINANTTATTAYAMTTNHPATFIAVDTTHWRVARGN